MKILKFGGTCLATEDTLHRMAKIVKESEGDKVVVVSAASGITNSIREFLSKPRQENEIDDFLLKTKLRHVEMLPKKDGQKRKDAIEQIETKITKLERLLYGVTYTEELTPRTNDLILSFGERLSSTVVASRLGHEGMDSIPLETDSLGMITNEQYGNAIAILDKCEKNMGPPLQAAVKKGQVPVVTGFFGITESGHVTTVGRSGTDYTAAVVGYALGAGPIEIWKEVDGFMSADPKLVKEAFMLDTLSYEEAAELAYFGAQVLHPRAVHPARLKGIEIVIKNLFKPESPGTVIGKSKSTRKDIIKSVSYVPNVATFKVYDTGAGYKSGFLADVTDCLHKAGINIFSAATSQTCVAILIDENDVPHAKKAVKALMGTMGESYHVVPNMALICTVGEGFGQTKGVAARVFNAVAAKSVNVDLISAGASMVAYHFTVDKKDLKNTVQAIHDEFWGKELHQNTTDNPVS